MSKWQKVKLGSICSSVCSGGTPKSTERSYYEHGTIPWLNSKEVCFSRIYSTEKKITQAGLDNSSAKWIKANSVIVAMYGATAGQVGITKVPLTTNQACCNLTINEDIADYNYVYYYLCLKYNELAGLANGGAQQNLNALVIKDFDILLPALPVQQKIANVLYSLDEKIELNAQINHNLEEQAKAIFKSWFIDFEPFGGVAPANWRKGKLKDILQLQKNAINAGENTDVPYLPIDSIPMRTFALTDTRPNSEAQSSLLQFQKNDILIGAMRVYFHRVIIAPFDGITRTTCFVLRPNNAAYLSFSLLACNQDSSIDFAQKTSKGSTMPYAVWEGGMGEIDLLIPPENIATKFNSIVFPMLKKIQESYFEVVNLKKLRDSLLPKLMSGEIDVSGINLEGEYANA